MSHEVETSNAPEGVTGSLIASQCLDIINQYRSEQMSKGDAIFKIVQAIPSGEDETMESPGKTLRSYISMLNDWDRDQTLSEGGVHSNEEREESRHQVTNSRERDRDERDETAQEEEYNEPVHK
jgi:hypothetical protein